MTFAIFQCLWKEQYLKRFIFILEHKWLLNITIICKSMLKHSWLSQKGILKSSFEVCSFDQILTSELSWELVYWWFFFCFILYLYISLWVCRYVFVSMHINKPKANRKTAALVFILFHLHFLLFILHFHILISSLQEHCFGTYPSTTNWFTVPLLP